MTSPLPTRAPNARSTAALSRDSGTQPLSNRANPTGHQSSHRPDRGRGESAGRR